MTRVQYFKGSIVGLVLLFGAQAQAVCFGSQCGSSVTTNLSLCRIPSTCPSASFYTNLENNFIDVDALFAGTQPNGGHTHDGTNGEGPKLTANAFDPSIPLGQFVKETSGIQLENGLVTWSAGTGRFVQALGQPTANNIATWIQDPDHGRLEGTSHGTQTGAAITPAMSVLCTGLRSATNRCMEFADTTTGANGDSMTLNLTRDGIGFSGNIATALRATGVNGAYAADFLGPVQFGSGLVTVDADGNVNVQGDFNVDGTCTGCGGGGGGISGPVTSTNHGLASWDGTNGDALESPDLNPGASWYRDTTTGTLNGLSQGAQTGAVVGPPLNMVCSGSRDAGSQCINVGTVVTGGAGGDIASAINVTADATGFTGDFMSAIISFASGGALAGLFFGDVFIDGSIQAGEVSASGNGSFGGTVVVGEGNFVTQTRYIATSTVTVASTTTRSTLNTNNLGSVVPGTGTAYRLTSKSVWTSQSTNTLAMFVDFADDVEVFDSGDIDISASPVNATLDCTITTRSSTSAWVACELQLDNVPTSPSLTTPGKVIKSALYTGLDMDSNPTQFKIRTEAQPSASAANESIAEVEYIVEVLGACNGLC